MGAARKIERFPDEEFIEKALKDGRATVQLVSMKALGKPDTAYQARVEHLDMEHVRRLAAILEEAGELGPVVIFKCLKTGKLILADGFHRHETYRKARRDAIKAYVIGTDNIDHDARSFAAMCNRRLCKPRSRDDIAKAVIMLLQVDAWLNASSGVIGNHVGTGAQNVRKIRLNYCAENNIPHPDYVTKTNGVSIPMTRGTKPRIQSYQPPGCNYRTYSTSINGKNIYLGTNENAASEKLDELLKERSLSRIRISRKEIVLYLLTQGVIARQAGSSRLGRCVLWKGCIGVAAESMKVSDLIYYVGCLLLNRAKHEKTAVPVVIGYDFPDYETIAMAKQIGVKFLAPEELTASLCVEPQPASLRSESEA